MAHCLIRIDTEHYGYVVSRHRTERTADDALYRQADRIRRRNPSALISCMYVVRESDARIGTRIRLDPPVSQYAVRQEVV